MAFGHECVSLAISTARGTPIPNERRMRLIPAMLDAGLADLLKGCPALARRRSLDNTYNCVGLVFASRRAHVDADCIFRILAEDGYREIFKPEAQVGDVVVYCVGKDAQHVGVIAEVAIVALIQEMTILSQFGPYAEYFHPIDVVPTAYGTPRFFFTDRKP